MNVRDRARQNRATRLATGGTPKDEWVVPQDEWVVPPEPKPEPDYAKDIGFSALTGVGKGITSMVGLPGDLGSTVTGIRTALAKKLGADDNQIAAINEKVHNVAQNVPFANLFTGPGSAELQKIAEENVTGEWHKPETVPGQYAQRTGEFIAGAALPGGAIRRAANVVVPALGAETAAQVAHQVAPSLEPYAPAVGAVLAPGAVSLAGKTLAPAVNPIVARLRPEAVADTKLAQALQRAGMTPQQLLAEMHAAGADQQTMFAVADALGPAGQRMLAGTTRQPHDARQAAIDFLEARQAGQSRRIVSDLSDAFASPDTAAQRTARLTATRTADADVNYDAARAIAVPVDVTPAIKTADAILQPGVTRVMKPQSNIADNSIEAAVRKARAYLTDGRSQVSDFQSAFAAKKEIDLMIETATPTLQRELIPIRNALDDALIKASGPYRQARDVFREQSRVIDAVPVGSMAATRGRTQDVIPAFRNLTPEQQTAFRAGYVDPLIAKAERAAVGENTARPFTSVQMQQELPAFAVPGRGDTLMRQLKRENTMFSTRNQAIGGSKTAENLADMADVSHVSPEVFFNLIHGNYMLAGKNFVTRLLSEARGMSPGVAAKVSETLTETDPARLIPQLRRLEAIAKRPKDATAIRYLMSGAIGAMNP